MMRKTFITTALIAAAAALAVAPSAQADDYKDYNDATADFVLYNTPAAATAQANHKQVLASIYGLDHPVYCKGTFPAGPFADCMQHDDFGWFHLSPTQLPQLGTVWTHLT
ncbi:hypothetical protein KO481_04550 [Nocardia sp. NEAU-G5]|uniref:Secreted protein n=1 Tax=Nocardia albiluteola TaxID=2842303 RepID=A0ABS6AUT3_9NOCA|nr:hypothetical protein [Nocardia albiluteola]MBU3060794.1 hypothetical protein [Nocardia albiluteola]